MCHPSRGLLKAIVLTARCVSVSTGNCGDKCSTYTDDYLGWQLPGVGRPLIFLAIQTVVFTCILFAIEAGHTSCSLASLCACAAKALPSRPEIINQLPTPHIPRMIADIGSGGEAGRMDDDDEENDVIRRVVSANIAADEDDDVVAERDRILAMPVKTLGDTLIIKELDKFYGEGFHAVDRLTLGVPEGECFGLLGINGAGKTTTFKMLTGDIPATSGDAYLLGVSVTNNVGKARQALGYCPQFDALIDQMTVRETLWMFARLKGIQEKCIDPIVDSIVNLSMLSKHGDKETAALR